MLWLPACFNLMKVNSFCPTANAVWGRRNASHHSHACLDAPCADFHVAIQLLNDTVSELQERCEAMEGVLARQEEEIEKLNKLVGPWDPSTDQSDSDPSTIDATDIVVVEPTVKPRQPDDIHSA